MRPAPAACGGEVRPLLSGGRRVVVEGHPICDCCGVAVAPLGEGRWRHAAGERVPRAPRFTAARLAAYRDHVSLRRAFPMLECSHDEWREAVARLDAFQRLSARAPHGGALRGGENPYADLVARLRGGEAGWRLTPGLAQLLALDSRRRTLVSRFAWAIPDGAALDLLERHAPLVECGAGTGYWAALLRARDADVIACDLAPPGAGTANAHHRHAAWTAIERCDSAAAARRHRRRTLFLSWPSHGDDAASFAVLRAYRGDTFVYVGEAEGGATGSVRFHRELALNWTPVEILDLPRWPGLRDRLAVYRRNAVRRPHRVRDRCFQCGRFLATGSIGRCDACFAARPPALALRVGAGRIEYPEEVLASLPAALRRAFEMSPSRIR